MCFEFVFGVRVCVQFEASFGRSVPALIRPNSSTVKIESNRIRVNYSVSITTHTAAIDIDVEMGETGGSVPDEVVDDENDKYNYYECE